MHKIVRQHITELNIVSYRKIYAQSLKNTEQHGEVFQLEGHGLLKLDSNQKQVFDEDRLEDINIKRSAKRVSAFWNNLVSFYNLVSKVAAWTEISINDTRMQETYSCQSKGQKLSAVQQTLTKIAKYEKNSNLRTGRERNLSKFID